MTGVIAAATAWEAPEPGENEESDETHDEARDMIFGS